MWDVFEAATASDNTLSTRHATLVNQVATPLASETNALITNVADTLCDNSLQRVSSQHEIVKQFYKGKPDGKDFMDEATPDHLSSFKNFFKFCTTSAINNKEFLALKEQFTKLDKDMACCPYCQATSL